MGLGLKFNRLRTVCVAPDHPVLCGFVLVWTLPRIPEVHGTWRRIQLGVKKSTEGEEVGYVFGDAMVDLGISVLSDWKGCTPEAVQACCPDRVRDEEVAGMRALLAEQALTEYPMLPDVLVDLVGNSALFRAVVQQIGVEASEAIKVVNALKEAQKNDSSSGAPGAAPEAA